MSVFLVALPAQNRSKHAFCWIRKSLCDLASGGGSADDMG